MKNTLIFLCIVITLLTTVACNNVYQETIITDVNSLVDIWQLPERRPSDTTILFPSTVNEDECINFYCKHSTYHLVGTGWQVELVVKYDNVDFVKEKTRLVEICKNSVVAGATTYFDYPTYATIWNWNGCFEYAVIDEKNMNISYIYLQLVDKNEITINKKFIPNKYETEMPQTPTYSIYT